MTGKAEPCDGADRCDIPMHIYEVRPRKDHRGDERSHMNRHSVHL